MFTPAPEPKGSAPSSHDPDATVAMPVIEVKPLKDKPGLTEQQIAEAVCEHVSWEVLGAVKRDGSASEHRQCSDCKVKWWEAVPLQEELEPEEEATPPKFAYARAQVVTYRVGESLFEILIQETTTVSVQQGVLFVQQAEGPVGGIVAVRPYMQEVTHGPDAQG